MFKEKLKERNLSQVLFDLFTDKLGEQGVIAKTDSMVDASFVDVPKQRNSKDDNDTIKSCIGLLNLIYNLFRYEQIIRLKIS